MLQQTIKKTVSISGIGLHSGNIVSLTLVPAPADTGIVFRLNHNGKLHKIKLKPTIVEATQLATTLGIDGTYIATVEHLLSALSGMQVDNIYIDIVGTEVPIVDGSAFPFVLLIEEAGIVEQEKQRNYIAITQECSVYDGNKFVKAKPYNGFFIDYTIDFQHPLIGVQHLALEITPTSFRTIAQARTFGFIQEIEYLRSKNLTLGGSLENAIVLDDKGILNAEGLRCQDEFVRHKMLDFIGDIALFGAPLQGHFTVHLSGHALNNQFVRFLYANKKEYTEKVVYQTTKQLKRKSSSRLAISSSAL